MSDAREVVQPRWKRRATEIADAIGGGTSSVTLSSQSINDMKQAFKEALYGTSAEQLAAGYQYCNSMMEVNLRSHPLSHMQQGGHLLVNTSSHPSDPGRFKPIAVTGNTLGLTGLPANSTSLPVQLMGIDASTGLVNPSLAGTPAIRVNVMNQNAIQTTVAGHVQVKSAIDPANSSNIIPMRVEVDQLPRYTNGNTKPVPIMSGSNFAGAVQELKVREQNLAGTAGNGIKTTETAPVTSVSVSGTVTVGNSALPVQPALDANNVAIPLSVTETAPVTTTTITGSVAVQPALDANNVAIPLSVTETAPVTTTTITGSVAVQPALDANNVAIPLSVTETNPVSGGGGGTTTGVQQVKIVGDETYGIIMTKNLYVTGTSKDYMSLGFGLSSGPTNSFVQGAYFQANVAPHYFVSAGWFGYSHGWTIRVNGVDIHNQDITLSLRGNTTLAAYNGGPTGNNGESPGLIEAANQTIIDTYHGRKVTLSSIANVWILEPIPDVDIQQVAGQNVEPVRSNIAGYTGGRLPVGLVSSGAPNHTAIGEAFYSHNAPGPGYVYNGTAWVLGSTIDNA